VSAHERGHLTTELRNARSRELDRLSALEAVDLIQREDVAVHRALYAARESIARAVELVSERLAKGGRLLYVGAGTSGRLAMLDAVECPPTFQSDPRIVQALLAGGEAALVRSVEGAEDDRDAAIRDLRARSLSPRDVVFGIAAGGTTPYVQAALEFAREAGAATIFLACVPIEQIADRADVSIRVVTGPEVLTGSTRLKAGTATKLVLNTISTIAMARLGKVYENLMVDLNTRGNQKLVDRGARIVAELTGLDRAASLELLERAGGEVKVAIVMQRRALDRERASEHLASAGGSLRRALEL
jgi:N-acetylmuramic acid 6-phosphate etherase